MPRQRGPSSYLAMVSSSSGCGLRRLLCFAFQFGGNLRFAFDLRKGAARQYFATSA
jgi:hypothetical protein